MRTFSTLLLAASIAAPLAITTAAHAEPPQTAPTTVAEAPLPPATTLTPAQPSRTWYGWQTLTADVLTLGTLGGPIVHAAHGNWGKAAGSLGIRVAATVAGFMLGMAATGVRGDTEMIGGGAGGAGCGLLAASIFDAAVLAYDGPRAPASRETARRVLAPQVGFVRGGATVGLGGSL